MTPDSKKPGYDTPVPEGDDRHGAGLARMFQEMDERGTDPNEAAEDRPKSKDVKP